MEGGLDWKPLSLTPAELDFINTKNAAAREIALALGVSRLLIGIPGDNTYSNYAEANRCFWRNTVLSSSPVPPRPSPPGSPGQSDTPLALIPDLDQIEVLFNAQQHTHQSPYLTDASPPSVR